MKRRMVLAVLLGVAAVLCAREGQAFRRPTETLMIETPDGVNLATDYYLPESGGPSWPVILTRTTYGKAMTWKEADAFNRRGYAYVAQDVRGQGYSKGERNVFFADGWRAGLQDGAFAVAWIEGQPWCNGKIGTVGGSALGITQILMAPTTKNLACQSIHVAPSNFYSYVCYPGGVWKYNLVEGWLTGLGLSNTIAQYKAHTTDDEFWAYYNAGPKAGEITTPAIHVGGWYDIFQQGTIDNFVTRQHNGGPGAKGNQKLIMRWSTHGGDDERDFHLNSNRRDLKTGEIERKFIDCWMKGDENGIMKEPAVWYYVFGDDRDPDAPGMEWRSADDWPPFPTVETPYYLAADGALSTAPATASGSLSFAFDPVNPFPTHGGANLLLPAGAFDQRAAREGRRDYVAFASLPLEAPLEATGRVGVRLYVSTDAPDTDFTAKLLDIFPEGDAREILILDSAQRVKFRNGFDKAAPLLASADEVVELAIDLWSTSWVFNKGHRIGVHISSSNYPRFEVNPNNGDDFPAADRSNCRIAHNIVHFGGAHASVLLLPVPKL